MAKPIIALVCASLTWLAKAWNAAVEVQTNGKTVVRKNAAVEVQTNGKTVVRKSVRKSGRVASTWEASDMEWRSDEATDVKLPEVYGNDAPRTYGLDRCVAYRAAVPFSKRSWGVAGLPNTGTHALYYSVVNNCQIPERIQKDGWQVPWGKHDLAHSWQTDAYTKKVNPSHENVMAIALVKDPLMWMASTCRRPYFKMAFDDGNSSTCPSPLSGSKVTEYGQGREDFESMMHLWSKWGMEYMNATRPFSLVIRFEDLLFAPKATTQKVCDCLGFPMNPTFKVLVSDSKAYQGPHMHVASNRASTLQKYTDKRNVTMDRLTIADHEFMTSVLQQTGADVLTRYFHYDYVANSDH